METIGADGRRLLTAIYAPPAPGWLRELPAVEVLRRVWLQQFYASETPEATHCRALEDVPPAELNINFPYDPEARFSQKRSTTWIGYRVHLTETCDADLPHLITNVKTTPAPKQDAEMTAPIHQALAANHSWQAKAGQGYDLAHFTIHWESQTVTCPQGQVANQWALTRDVRGHAVIRVKFPYPVCRACLARPVCTHAKSEPRELTFRLQAEYEALQTARQRQTTPEWKEQYHQRAGIVGTISQGVRSLGLRRTRYIGLAKTRLQHVLTAAAINLTSLYAWLTDVPLAPTRTSHFATLCASSA